MTTAVQTTMVGNIAILTLNQTPVNALDEAAVREILDAVNDADGNNNIRVIIISSGIKSIFCTGGDLKYWPRTYPKQADVVSRTGQNLFTRIESLAKPSIAAIDGKVIGDGISLALSCDIRLGSTASTFRLPEVDYGFIPGWGTIGRLVRAVGRSKAAELLLTGDMIDAEQAAAIGLINRIDSTPDIIATAMEMAVAIAAKPPAVVRAAKAAIYGTPGESDTDREEWEMKCFASVWGGPDWRAGIDRLFGK